MVKVVIATMMKVKEKQNSIISKAILIFYSSISEINFKNNFKNRKKNDVIIHENLPIIDGDLEESICKV